MTTLGKILGSGLPIAAFGGRKQMMQQLSPLGPVYQAGTLSGNPVAVSAALWVMEQLGIRGKEQGARDSLTVKKINQKAEKFYAMLRREIKRKKLPVQLNTCASMFTLFFTPDPVTNFASAKKSDTKRFAQFFQACLQKGIYLAPSQFEANFISAAQSTEDLERISKVLLSNLS